MKTCNLLLVSILIWYLTGCNSLPEETESVKDGPVKTNPFTLNKGTDQHGWTYLVYAKPLSYSVGWGELRLFKHNNSGKASIAGQQLETAIYAHANSSVKYILGGKCKSFYTEYGLSTGAGGVGRFIIICDGEEMFRSSRLWSKGGTERTGLVHPVSMDVTGVKIIELRTTGDDNGSVAGSHTIWGNPKVK